MAKAAEARVAMPRPQFSLKWLLGLVFWLAAIGGWLSFLRDMEQSAEPRPIEQSGHLTTPIGQFVPVAAIYPNYADRVSGLLERNGIESIIEGSVVYGVSVPRSQEARALSLLRADSAAKRYRVQFK